MKIKFLGASSAHRWWNCWSSPRAELSALHTEHEAAISNEGSAAHRLLELCLRKKQDAEDYLDEEIWVPRPKIHHKVGEEMVEHIQAGLDVINKYKGKGQLWLEHEVSLRSNGIIVRGTLDCGWYGQYLNEKAKKEYQLHILDLKYGYLLVEAHDNKQLYIYALGKWRELVKKGKQIDTIHLWVYQPRSQSIDGPFKHVIIEPFDLMSFEEELHDVVQKIDSAFSAGPWCLHCHAHATCPTAERAYFRLIRTKYRKDDTGRVGELLFRIPQMLAWAKDVKALGETMAHSGSPPIGWMLGLGRNARRFPGDNKDHKTMIKTIVPKLKKLGLKEEDVTETKLLSVAKIERKVPKPKRDAYKNIYITVRGRERLVPEKGNAMAVDTSAYFDEEHEEE